MRDISVSMRLKGLLSILKCAASIQEHTHTHLKATNAKDITCTFKMMDAK